jgi:tRNA A37 threonylcarbamoyladenosine dehydratase
MASGTADLSPSAEHERRFGGLARLYGVVGAQQIQQAHVVVVGIGGVGSWTVEALARSGVGRLTLIDLDHVAESNVNRQVHALTKTLGMAKVQAMQQRISQINPACQVHCIEEFVTPENWARWVADLPWPCDALVDACDQVRAKASLAAWALDTHTHFISVGAAGGKRHAHGVDIQDLSLVTHDPLLAQLRYNLRKSHGAPRDGKKIGVACVFSREPVAPPDPSCGLTGDGSLNCHGYGSVVSVTATFGQCAAGWILDALSKQKIRKDAKNPL